MNVVIILLMASAFLLTRVINLRTAVSILLAQSVIIAAASLAVGLETGQEHYFMAALLTVVIKAMIIPYVLFRIVRRLRKEREGTALNPNLFSLAAVAAIALAYGFIDKALPGIISRDALAAAVALVFIGLQIIMFRSQAVLQIVGLNTMENGLYLLSLSVTKGLPLMIELGIFLDVLVAVGILGLLTYRLKLSFLSTDTTVLERLKG